ncbi:MAG: type II toxin-antitoxin system HicA family toxin [Chloroflexi bacterium]|nr:type II toxin-antitoxin system HicA family toxin [Chloroflexota bacterium]
MPKLPSVKGHEVLRVLLKAGFYIHHQRGSHARLFHSQRTDLRITVPIHSKDLPERTLRAILKQADLTEEDFLNLLKS